MKLRYYLRGLGIGMIVTAFLMGMALKDGQPMSDAEIKARAIELGMVEENSRTLADVQASNDSQPSAADIPASTVKPDSTAEPTARPDKTAEPTAKPGSTAEPTAKPDKTAEPTEKPGSTAAPTAKPDGTSEPTAKPEETPVSTEKPSDISASGDGQTESVTFVVRSGQSSYTVSKALAEAGLIEDALDFDRYLVNNGYSKRINTGTYEISMGSTEEEIAKIITRSK